MEVKPNKFWKSLKLPFKFIVLLWAIHLLQFFTSIDLGILGIYPRTILGLRGILFSPLIHGSFPHLISNSAPLFVLSAMILFFYPRVAVKSFTMIYLLTGAAVWLFARPVFHIGASGVIYGLLAFVFWSGIFRRNLKSIVLALIVTFLYSGFFLGILPSQEGISWESHLMGGLVGLFASFWFKDEVEQDEKKTIPSWEQQQAGQIERGDSFFLDRDIFEKTKETRTLEKREEGPSGWFSSKTWED